MIFQKSISCLLILVGLGWVFAEVRRFIFHNREFFAEAAIDESRGHWTDFVMALGVLFYGATRVFNQFGFGHLSVTSRFPYLEGGPDAHRFWIVFGAGTVTWMVLSTVSTEILLPPIFDDATTERLCKFVRGTLFTFWVVVMAVGFVRMASCSRAMWLIGLLVAGFALWSIISGSLGTSWEENWWNIPPITCDDRPFPYVATVLFMIGLAGFCFIAPAGDLRSSDLSGPPTVSNAFTTPNISAP